jgi:hypothetical protein
MRTKRSTERLSETVTRPTFVVGGRHAGDNDQSNIVCFGEPVIPSEEYHKDKNLCSRSLTLEAVLLHEQKDEWSQSVLLRRQEK